MTVVLAPAGDERRRGFDAKSREVFGQMFTRLKFNEHLVKTGFCKQYIKDMSQDEYDDYLRKLYMLQRMSDLTDN